MPSAPWPLPHPGVQSGGVLAIQIANLPGNRNVSAAVFARWLSLVYMSLAQMGVPHPGAMEQDGWAWVSGGGASSASSSSAGAQEVASGSSEGSGESTTLEAYGLADFVVHTLRNEERKEQQRGAGRTPGSGGSGSSGGDAAAAGEGAVEGVLLRKPKEVLRQGFVSIEDPNLLSTSPTALVMSQQISLVQVGAAAAGAGGCSAGGCCCWCGWCCCRC